MSLWTHNICEDCWERRSPGRLAQRVGAHYRAWQTCCFCALLNDDGIFVREAPDSKNLAASHAAIHALNEKADEDGPA